jgi:amidohydrolase
MSSETRALSQLRRSLHRIPELGFEEHSTHALLSSLLGEVGTPQVVAGTGLIVDLGPEDAPRTVLLRADMDGLPIQEDNAVDYASTHPGRMHACGHDAHMAALVAAGQRLVEAGPQDCRVRLLFQPAEEGAGGAVKVIEEGGLRGVDVAFGIHVWNELPVGTVAVTPGGIMAGVVEVHFVVRGRGGHGALPDRTKDPLLAGAQLVVALQTVASRLTSPFEPVVVSIGAFQAGEAFNVIPESATLVGTVRTFSVDAERRVEAHIREIAAGVGAASGCTIEVNWRRYAGPTVNDPRVAARVAEVAAAVPGIETVLTDYRTMAGEDFGDLLEAVPGCFVLLGSAPADGRPAEPHHSPRFDIDEAVLPIARDLHVAVAHALARI